MLLKRLLTAALFVSSIGFSKTIDSFVVKDTDITTVAQMIAKLTDKNIVIPHKIHAKVTIVIRNPITDKELWDIFTRILIDRNYTIQNKNGTIIIIPASRAKYFKDLKKQGFDGELVTQVFVLKNISANEAQNIVRPFISPYGRISLSRDLNTLIVTDFATNVKLISKILQSLENKEKYTYKVFKFESVEPREFERFIKPYIDYERQNFGERIYYSISGDTLFLVASNRVVEKIENLYEDFKKKYAQNKNFKVFKLKYTSADDVFKKLRNILSQSELRNFVKITEDKTNNAVIAYGTPYALKKVGELISKIDIRKKQVLIMATIVEASLQDITDLGVKWQLIGSNGGVALGATSLQDFYSSLASGQFVVGGLSASGKSVSIGGTNLFFPDLALLFYAITKNSGFNVISNPKILTLDNEEATIRVGQKVPYPQGIKYDVNGNPIITYNYKDVGLTLKVKPQIAKNNLYLRVKLKVQDITGYITNTASGINYSVPITSNRELNSDFIVHNGETVIIGGLINRKTIESISKTPILGDFPLLGALFKQKHREKSKTSLFIFITPYVISSPDQLAKIMEEHKKLAMEIAKKLEGKIKKKKKESKTAKENPEDYIPYW